MDYVDRSSSRSVDVSKLDVCFGGFTPMALSDGSSTREQVLEAERRVREHREAVQRALALEAARESEERVWTDGAGNEWRYVVLDDAEVKIVKACPCQRDLIIPSSIEGKPVVSLGDDSCSYLKDVESIEMPDTVVSVGYSALRECRQLKRVAFSKNLSRYDFNWLRNCKSIEYLQLPGAITKLDAQMLEAPKLKELRIGASVNEVLPGMFQHSCLERIEVDAANPLLTSDGKALYSADGSILVALAVPCETYRVAQGCTILAKKAFSQMRCVREIELPDTIELIGDFAFAQTSLSSFVAPPALKMIGEKAFFNCAKLASVRLNEGLSEVHDNAFSGTRLTELRLPASVERLGESLAAQTDLVYAGEAATFSIAPNSRFLMLDEMGCLYKKADEGLVLARMMNPGISSYVVKEGTVRIADDAFFSHESLERIELPEGLKRIGKRAFKSCRSLKGVRLPSTVDAVGDEAFLDTGLESLSLPAALKSLGTNAFVTYGAHKGDKPTLKQLDLDPANEGLSMQCGMLLERKVTGRARVLLCPVGMERIRIPEEVDEIAPYAFNGMYGIKELFISDRITNVGICGLHVDCLVEHIHIDLAKPIQGHDFFDLRFPQTDRGEQQQMLALSVPDHVDVEVLFSHYDSAVVNASSFDFERAGSLPLYDQATRVIERLKDPIYLTPVNRSMCERMLETNLCDICVEAAKHDDRAMLDDLLGMGCIHSDNINEVIDRVGAVQDASMTGYLLEVKRERFGKEAFDFDL